MENKRGRVNMHNVLFHVFPSHFPWNKRSFTFWISVPRKRYCQGPETAPGAYTTPETSDKSIDLAGGGASRLNGLRPRGIRPLNSAENPLNISRPGPACFQAR